MHCHVNTVTISESPNAQLQVLVWGLTMLPCRILGRSCCRRRCHNQCCVHRVNSDCNAIEVIRGAEVWNFGEFSSCVSVGFS
eukprot:1713139-Amphidinium_carterae.1